MHILCSVPLLRLNRSATDRNDSWLVRTHNVERSFFSKGMALCFIWKPKSSMSIWNIDTDFLEFNLDNFNWIFIIEFQILIFHLHYELQIFTHELWIFIIHLRIFRIIHEYIKMSFKDIFTCHTKLNARFLAMPALYEKFIVLFLYYYNGFVPQHLPC